MCITTLPSFGQGLGFGNIAGIVQDATGAVITGAKVTISNHSKGITREMDTTSAGTFSAPALVPASGYEVTITMQGFAPVNFKNITVQVGETVNLNPILKIAVTRETVEVSAAMTTVDATRVDNSSVVNSDQILGLPTSGRRVDQFVLLTPGVTNDGNFGLLSFRGNPGGNSFLTDGVDTTNSYYDENAGRTRTYNISQDAVQEFEVVSSNYLAEFGKASGGVVNTVTRSGSNSFHGSAYEFFRNTTLNAKDRNTVSGLLPTGINPPASRHLAGLSIGGPIRKDKLFFFFNGELLRRIDPAFSSNIGSSGQGNNVFDGLGNITARDTCVLATALRPTVRLPSGATVPGPTAAQCATAISYLRGRALPQLISRKFDNNLLFGKIDWRPTAKDSLSFSGNYLDFRSPNGIQSSGIAFTTGNAIGNNADTNVFDRTARASWTRIITNNMLNELRYGFFVDRQFDPNSPSLMPSWGAFGPSPVQLTLDSVINLGYATNYPRLNPRETRNEVADNLSWTKGQHNFKFGATFANVADHVISMANQFPTYTYTAVTGGANALTLFALDINGTTPQGNQAWTSYSQTVGTRQIDYDLWETSLYGQDQWRITPKLTITPGVRFEHSTIPQPNVCNPLFPQTCTIPTDHNTSFSPRLGIAYAMGSKTAIHAGYGMFYNRYATAAIENLLTQGNGVYQLGYSNPTITSAEYAKAGHGVLGCLPTFPNLEPFNFVATGACAKSITPNILYADKDYRPAYSEQMTLAIDRELFKNTSLSFSYIWSRSLHIPVSYDTNVLDPTNNLTYKVLDATGAAVGSYTTPIYTSFNPAYTFNGSQYKGRVSVAQSGANSYYNALLVNLKHRYSNWLQGDVSYTYGHTIDWNVGIAPTFGSSTPTSYVNGDYRGDKGSSGLDRRHLLIMNAVFSPTFMHSDGMVAKYLVNGWNFSFIEQLASSQPLFPGFFSASMPTSGATATAIATANSFPVGTSMISSSSLNGLGGLGRIPFESMSALNMGAWYRTDARLAKTFPITEQLKVNFGIEAFNLFNSLIPTSRDTNQYQVAFPTSGPNLGFATLTPRSQYGTVTATIDALNGTNARRANAFVRITW